MLLILQLAIILFASKIAGDLSVRLGQPSVLGKLLVGIILGPTVLGVVTNSDILKEISNIGVILLMFVAGLETDVNEFKRSAKAATNVGVAGILAPLGLGYVAGMFMGMHAFESIFLGLLLSATSVSISVQTLKELDQLKSKEGSAIMGAAVIDDVLVILGLAFLMSFAGGDVNLGMVVLKKVIFFGAIILISWKVVPWFLKRFAPLQVTETVFAAGLIICFSFAYFAEYTGVAAIIGAYIAGIAISMTKFRDEVSHKAETISYSLFVPVFFTSIGVSAEFSGIVQNLGLIVVLSLIAIVTKLVGGAIGARISGFKWKNSMAVGAAMISRGEVALIIAAIGLENKLLSADLFAVLIVVVLVTTIVTPPLMKFFFSRLKDDGDAVALKKNA
ncbi:cation:proton antiporter [Brevibacillus panacihumi]|uniref:Cation:proton antiporter n=1 Tax=Brevibacillus panacihumi TaxID=497735 RepID=A0A3M8D610_9BACL|nr:cation:proton antiporter [Brevibacillus panacihumi]RNB83480.1 cation:proton antiporter [Brevibacillus panacihumi]